jgi:hypothetical protein
MRVNMRKCSVPSVLIAITNEPSEIWYWYGFYTYLHITYEILFVTVVNDYGDDANFEVISDKFNVHRICTQVIKTSQKMKKINNSNKEIDSLEKKLMKQECRFLWLILGFHSGDYEQFLSFGL